MTAVHDAIKGLHFFTRFAYSFSALGYRHRQRGWQEPAGDFSGQRWLVTGASGQKTGAPRDGRRRTRHH